MASKPCARCAAKSCTCGLPRRRPTDSERLTAILKLGLVEYYIVGVVTTRSEIDGILREEAKRAKGA